MGEFLFGKDCDNCSDLGVSCKQFGLLSIGPAYSGETLITVDDAPALRTTEKIDDCLVLLKTEKKEAVVSKIRKNYQRVKNIVPIDRIGNY